MTGAKDVQQDNRTVIAAAAAGTALEWYDFFLFGALATILSKHFFANLPESQAFIMTLLTFAAGFVARPFGALVFGKVGDAHGRKGAFLTTIVVMGAATLLIGLLPGYAQAGIFAPLALVSLRIVQGFALGGEYGGAAIYVAEHSPSHRRGFDTSWIQTSAAIGLTLALVVVLGLRSWMGEDAFADWGWRIPFIGSIFLLGVSLWIRLQLSESPVFKDMQASGRNSQRSLADTFMDWRSLKLVLLALFGVMMAQGVVWYTAYFYGQFFLEKVLKVPGSVVTEIMLVVSIVSMALYVFFGWLSDKVGRKPVMVGGMALMLAAYFPGFQALTQFANPAMAEAMATNPVIVVTNPSECAFQLDLIGGSRKFTSACDVAKSALAGLGVSYASVAGAGGAEVRVGGQSVQAPALTGLDAGAAKAAKAEFEARLKSALVAAGYPAAADMARFSWWGVVSVMLLFIVAATAMYGPLAAFLVELFPARIRYTALSFPYHIGAGWFGGFMPAIGFSIVTATGETYAGLWYPFVITAIALAIAIVFLPETRGRDVRDEA
jgi:MFS family permease